MKIIPGPRSGPQTSFRRTPQMIGFLVDAPRHRVRGGRHSEFSYAEKSAFTPRSIGQKCRSTKPHPSLRGSSRRRRQIAPAGPGDDRHGCAGRPRSRSHDPSRSPFPGRGSGGFRRGFRSGDDSPEAFAGPHRHEADNGSLDLEITNDGRSRAPRRPQQQGIGLQIMKSRSEAMGALLHVRSLAPRGMLVRCSVPLSGAEGLVIRT